jgi:DNA-binding response OmpR family regulator
MAHILVIEDDLTMQKVYSEVLTKEGFIVTAVGTGPEGMKIIANNTVNLIILDIMLPGGMNGFDILQQLKRDDKLKNTPVIVLTNLDTEKQTAFDYGAVDYYVKSSMELHVLVEKIKTHLSS